MKNSLIIMKFKEVEVRQGIMDEGRPYWVAKDVCKALEIKNHRQALTRLDKDEKDDVIINDAIGRGQQTTVVFEPGVYKLIQTSNKPVAKEFDRWVRHEVLPEIRRTGNYTGDKRLFECYRCQCMKSKQYFKRESGLRNVCIECNHELYLKDHPFKIRDQKAEGRFKLRSLQLMTRLVTLIGNYSEEELEQSLELLYETQKPVYDTLVRVQMSIDPQLSQEIVIVD